VCSGLQFFYRVTLKRREAEFCLPRPKVPSRLPEILSREEIAALIDKTANLKHRAVLMTTYAGGLRVSEVCQLKVTDIDSQRMTIRVEQAKAPRIVTPVLSPRLLTELRRYWLANRPEPWLFPGARAAAESMAVQTAQRIFRVAKDRAGITKDCGIHGLRHAFATHLLGSGRGRASDSAAAGPRQFEHHGPLLPSGAAAPGGRCLAARSAGAPRTPRVSSARWARIRTARMRQRAG